MSNSKNILYLISLILLMLTGCEAETSWAPLPNEEEEPVEVRFHATTFGANVEVSRATSYEDNTFHPDYEIGIWNDYYSNIKMIYTNTENGEPNLNTINNEKIYFPYQTEEMKVYAYAPYSDTQTDLENKTVNVRSEWEDNTVYADYIVDPLWSSCTVIKENPMAYFYFSHQMARLRINLKMDVPLDNYTITITFDRPQCGTMSLTDGSITPLSQGSEYNYNIEYTNQGSPDEDLPTSYDFTILPGTVLKKIHLVYNEDKRFTKEYTEENPFGVFNRGTVIIVNLDFTKKN